MNELSTAKTEMSVVYRDIERRTAMSLSGQVVYHTLTVPKSQIERYLKRTAGERYMDLFSARSAVMAISATPRDVGRRVSPPQGDRCVSIVLTP